METIEFQLPEIEYESFNKLVKKLEKKVSFIHVEYGKRYKKLYRHVERDIEGFCTTVKMWHEVIDTKVEMNTINDWMLLVTYKDDLEFIANPTKELILNNPLHGKDYRKCDVCGHWCKNSYVVYNTQTGEELQVGKECLKSFGLDGISFIYDFTRELYRMIDWYSSCDDGETLEWRGKKDKTAFSSCKTVDLLRAAKAYYNECKEWKRGYYEGRTYYKSESNDRIQHNLMDKIYDGDDEYISRVIEHIKGIKESNSEFQIDMLNMVNCFYTKPSFAAHAYFAIKMYEESIKAKEIDIERLKPGMQVHVVGNVIKEEEKRTIYGIVTKYTIDANGIKFVRTGKIKMNSDKTCEFYAVIKFVRGITVVIDRATKNPKKGIETINV